MKTYVAVSAHFDTSGNIFPDAVIWKDGKIFQIDRILDRRPCSSLKRGGFGIRYTCRIRGKETYLFLEENRWFVESK